MVKDGLTELPDNNVACEGSVGTGKFAQEKFEKLIVVGASAVNMALSSTDRHSRVAFQTTFAWLPETG